MELAGQVKAAFYVVQADQQKLEMFQQVTKATEASYDAASRLHEAGNIRDLDLDNERALYVQANLNLAAAESAVVEGREPLNALMGLWGADTQWKIDSRLPEVPEKEIDLDRLESRAIAASIDLSMGSQAIESRAHQLGLVKVTALVPELELGATGERDGGEWEVGPSFAFPIPFFNQGQARIAAARAELRRRQAEHAALAVEIRSAVRASRQRLLTARDISLYYRFEILPLRHRIVNETQLEYNAMQIGVFQLLLARQREIEAGRRYIDSLLNYWLSRTELEQILSGRHADLSSRRPAMSDVMESASMPNH